MFNMAIKYPGRFVWFKLTSVVDGTRGLCQITKWKPAVTLQNLLLDNNVNGRESKRVCSSFWTLKAQDENKRSGYGDHCFL